MLYSWPDSFIPLNLIPYYLLRYFSFCYTSMDARCFLYQIKKIKIKQIG